MNNKKVTISSYINLLLVASLFDTTQKTEHRKINLNYLKPE